MGRPTAPYWFALGILVLPLAGLRLAPLGWDVGLPSPLETFPATLGEWREGPTMGWEPPALPETTRELLFRTYARGGEPPVSLYIAYWRRQQPGEVAFTARHADPGRGWSFVREDLAHIPATSRWGPDFTVTRALYERAREGQLVTYWFIQPGRRAIGSRYWGRAYMLWDYLTRFRTDVALIRVASPANSGTASAAFESHKTFIRAALPALERLFGG